MLDVDTPTAPAFSESSDQASDGLSRGGMTLYLAGCSYLNKGGTGSELVSIFARLVGEFNLNDDAGTSTALPEKASMAMLPASSPLANGRGLIAAAQSRQISRVPPVREPSRAQIDSRDNVKGTIAASIFDTFKLRDGRMIGDVRYGELARLETSGLVEAEVFRAIRKRGVAAHDAKVRHIIKPAVLNRIVLKAKENCRAQ